MLQYLIVLLDDTSTSFCHYENVKTERRLIPIETLKAGIRFGMMENLMIQFVYPDYELSGKYKEIIESIDHSKIKPTDNDADIWVTNSIKDIETDVSVVWRTDKQTLFGSIAAIMEVLEKVPRLNIVLKDIESFTDNEFEQYKELLEKLSVKVEQLYVSGRTPQINLLTDRFMLKEMNNCGAADSNITLAPNGKFYVCPAFYYENSSECVGDLEHGLDIKNKQLYKLDYAPICRHCDAYQCKRCIWLNKKTTLEVNTPSHEQCVMAHLERNASRILLKNIRKHGTFLPEQEDISEIDYLDPFDKREEWK